MASGLKATRLVVETWRNTCTSKASPRIVRPEEIFAPSTLDL
jgi:hypothetical protein